METRIRRGVIRVLKSVKCTAIGPLISMAILGCSEETSVSSFPDEEVVVSKTVGPLLVGSSGLDFAETLSFINPSDSRSVELQLDGKSCSCLAASPQTVVIPPGGDATVTLSTHLEPANTTRRLSAQYKSRGDSPRRWVATLTINTFSRTQFSPPEFAPVTVQENADTPFLFSVLVRREPDQPREPIEIEVDDLRIRIVAGQTTESRLESFVEESTVFHGTI